MNRGQKLGELLSEMEANHRQMIELFIKNNLSEMNLLELPSEDYEEWYRLKNANDRLGNEVLMLITVKTI